MYKFLTRSCAPPRFASRHSTGKSPFLHTKQLADHYSWHEAVSEDDNDPKISASQDVSLIFQFIMDTENIDAKLQARQCIFLLSNKRQAPFMFVVLQLNTVNYRNTIKNYEER